ncbi:hypothetical protein L5515_013058 [Caenorhabditis briggsae]|uniref:Uncharacterized protein n=1 Tax=Caenorhabditis briggsae TaxID=6238 RepID=A0AAE9E9J6_CAEBR|nr:hypothetical protein L5515_013058 [Caenorhabditis briggsae]
MGADLLPQYGKQQMDHHHLNSTSWIKGQYSSAIRTISVQTGHREALQIDFLRSKITSFEDKTSHRDKQFFGFKIQRTKIQFQGQLVIGTNQFQIQHLNQKVGDLSDSKRTADAVAERPEPRAKSHREPRAKKFSELKAVQHQAATTDPVDKVIVDVCVFISQ